MKGDGLFVDCRSHWKGRIGTAAMSFAKYEGGVLSIGLDGADQGLGLERALLQMGLRLRLVCRAEEGAADSGQEVLIRQENDPAPKIHFLEEGPVRIGLRVAFDLLDEAGHYHGDGRQDVWLYPEGDLHFSCALHVLDEAGHGAVRDCYLEIEGDAGYQQIELGAEKLLPEGGEQWIGFGAEAPGKALVLLGAEPGVALYWARDEGELYQMGYDHGPLPPFYASRWPTGMQQWSRGHSGWALAGEKAGMGVRMGPAGPNIHMAWRRDDEVGGEVIHLATLVVSMAADRADLQHRIEALQRPLTPAVQGGNLRCFTDEDGTYEIEQGDPTRVVVEFPPDVLERVARIRYYRRKTDARHRGGVRVCIDGEPVRPQLMSEGELTDDICVVMEMSHRNDSVDDVLVSVPLQAQRPTEVVIEKVPGIQVAYESEITGLDLQRRAGNRRDLVVWSSHNKDCPAFELDLFSCALHRVTGHGQRQPALWEMPMAWFKSCGISKHHYCNFIKEFSIDETGPEAVQLYLRGTNPNQRAQSEVWMRMPYDHPRLRLEVRMRMEILQQWDYGNLEFSDIFPYPSRLVETWFHEGVIFVQRDGTSMVYTYRPDRSVYPGKESDDERLFYGLYATDRGNVLTLLKNNSQPRQNFHYSVCGNYIDVHVNLEAGEEPVRAGRAFEVEYICELYGDGATSVDEIKQIGLRSLEAGDIVVPPG